MLRLAADENFNQHIVDGIRRHNPEIDLLRIQNVGLSGVEDPALLDSSALEGRVLLTHDQKTMPRFANERLAEGKPTAVLVVPQSINIGQAIDEIVLIAECSSDEEWRYRVEYLPLK